MYKLMIVDDQIVEIEAIRELLDWTELGIEIVGQATNGKHALEEARRLTPDIVIADIVMPGMDGLEMMRQLSECLPDIKIAFMSCFDDFKFVGPAINQGAYGYVLKPILAGELAKTVNRILKTCERERKNMELFLQKQKIEAGIGMLRESFFRNLLFGALQDEGDIEAQSGFLGLEVANRSFCVAVVELERREEEKVLFHAVSLMERLRQQFKPGYVDTDFILLDLHRICILLGGERESSAQQKKKYRQRVQEILEYINSTSHPLKTGSAEAFHGFGPFRAPSPTPGR